MMGILSKFSDAVTGRKQPRPDLPDALGCSDCGFTFGSSAAYTVAHDEGRCLPPHTWERLLVQNSGVWCTPGSDAARL